MTLEERLASLEQEVARLSARVAELEGVATASKEAEPAPQQHTWFRSPAQRLQDAERAQANAKAHAVACHPDRGGSHEASTEATRLYEEAKAITAQARADVIADMAKQRLAEERRQARSARGKAQWARRKAAKQNAAAP